MKYSVKNSRWHTNERFFLFLAVQGEFQSVVYTFNPGRVLTPFDTSSLTGSENVPTSSVNAVKKGAME